MTLSDLASLICVEINQQEPEDISACKTFLQRGFAIIWQAALWKDSLFEYTQTLGAVADYVVTDTWLPTKKVLLLPIEIHQPVAVRTDTGKLNVETSETFYRADWDQFADTGKPRNYRLLSPCAWELDTAMSVDISGGDDDATETTDYLSGDGVTVTRLTAPVGTAPIIYAHRINAVTKQVTSSDLTFGHSGTVFLTLAAADTSAPKRQRIQLFGTVNSGTVIRVLGKVKAPTFTADADEPALTGCEDSLIAFAQARMLRRERQYAKAQGMMQEAAGLLAQLKAEQTVQQAYNKRLIPEQGYGDEWGFTSGVFSTLP